MLDVLPACRVLLVDDQTIVVEKIKRELKPYDEITFAAVTLAEVAVGAAQAFKPTVILQDLTMPYIDGLELLRRYRQTPDLTSVPVIILSATNDPEVKAKCFSQGANDYIVKMPEIVELVARIRSHSGAFVARQERDDAFHLLKISQQQLAEANEQLKKLNGLDALSGIGNRRKFDETMSVEWGRGLRNGSPLSLIMCDIDFFKRYNDFFGHVSGDACIKRTAMVLVEELRRPADTLTRYGGEEFAIILPETSLEGALLVAENCRARVERSSTPIEQLALGRPLTMSFGVASMVPSISSTVVSLIEAADIALYEAKNEGRNTVKSRQ